MFFVYLLQDSFGKLYIGFSNNVIRRFKEHLNGKVYTTKRMDGLTLIYYEAYDNEDMAKQREKKLKQFGSSYQGLIKRLGIRN